MIDRSGSEVDFTDVFVRREAGEGLETASEVVSGPEVGDWGA